MSEETATPFASWAILELMGHRRLAGYVTEQEIAGHGFLRLDVPKGPEGGLKATQFYAPAAVYAITPCLQATAVRMAALADPAPVHEWELPEPKRIEETPGTGSTLLCEECEHTYRLHQQGERCAACDCPRFRDPRVHLAPGELPFSEPPIAGDVDPDDIPF